MSSTPNIQDEAVKFLERDFSESYGQLRHYDTQITDLMKFSVTLYIATLSAAIGVYQFSLEKGFRLDLAVKALLISGLLAGLLMLWLLVRSRVYFVRVARYINEHRHFFTRVKPLGFPNDSAMYTDAKYPKYFSWGSSHSVFAYVASAMNASLLATLLFVHFSVSCHQRTIVASAFLFALVVQVMVVSFHLKGMEKHTEGVA
ncbi:MAG: hypothetical protein IPJ87_01630 [Flavobacteriales bacterium]|nr:hypothetical protein [Flavobacteriales bacterium]MBK7940572.1 hypothetical protein [Flavobacteriales bacterium]MBK8950314.1 hypothetical protein [Flavobacteriales bacterium]MBK9701009.1 hypothetical protein [Flavobacteriales bacterium]